MRRRHMVGIARFADAEQQHGVVVLFRYAFQQRKCSRLADGDAVAGHVERAAGSRRCELQGVKAVQGGKAQRVHAAHQRRVDEACLDHAACRAEHLGAGGARAGNRNRGSPQAATLPNVVRDGEVLWVEPYSKLAGRAPLIGSRCGRQARSAGFRRYWFPRTRRCVAGPNAPPSAERCRKTILQQAQLCEAVIAAVELPQPVRQPGAVDTRHFADVGVDVHGLEIANGKAAALLLQRLQGRRHAFADAAGGREGLEQERLHRGSAERRVTGCKSLSAMASSSRGSTSTMTGRPLWARAALPSCSSKMSPPCSGFANLW